MNGYSHDSFETIEKRHITLALFKGKGKQLYK